MHKEPSTDCLDFFRLLLRISPIINDPSQVEISLEAFGCSLEVVPDILQTAKAHHLNVVGVA